MLRRAIALGVLGFVLGAGPVVLALALFDAKSILLWSFVLYKGVWTSLLAGIISPFVAWWALASASLESGVRVAS